MKWLAKKLSWEDSCLVSLPLKDTNLIKFPSLLWCSHHWRNSNSSFFSSVLAATRALRVWWKIGNKLKHKNVKWDHIKFCCLLWRPKNCNNLKAHQVSSPFFSNLFTLFFPQPFTFFTRFLLSLGNISKYLKLLWTCYCAREKKVNWQDTFSVWNGGAHIIQTNLTDV